VGLHMLNKFLSILQALSGSTDRTVHLSQRELLNLEFNGFLTPITYVANPQRYSFFNCYPNNITNNVGNRNGISTTYANNVARREGLVNTTGYCGLSILRYLNLSLPQASEQVYRFIILS
jgi:hypothetical protein